MGFGPDLNIFVFLSQILEIECQIFVENLVFFTKPICEMLVFRKYFQICEMLVFFSHKDRFTKFANCWFSEKKQQKTRAQQRNFANQKANETMSFCSRKNQSDAFFDFPMFFCFPMKSVTIFLVFR